MSKVIIGITGHRALGDEQKEQIKPLLVKAIQDIIFVSKKIDPSCSFAALSALAEGADSLFAEVALILQLHLTVILPFEKERYLKTFSSDDTRTVFNRLYDATDDKTVLNVHSNKDEPQLYLEVGQKIADDSDYLIAVWNEAEAKGKGGTAEIVAYAMGKGKKILLINPERINPYIKYV